MLDKHLEWLRNIRTLARDDLHLANVLLDTMPDGAPGLAKGTDILPTATEPVKVPDTRPNVDEIELLLSDGKRIPVIQAFRKRTGMGLKESRDILDAWCEKVGLPTALPGKPVKEIIRTQEYQTKPKVEV